MKTQIYKTYLEFISRDDKSTNGVSPEFSEKYPDYAEMNHTNTGCWNCRSCSDCRSCSYCSDCSDCRSCSYCSDCRYCGYCRGVIDYTQDEKLETPVIKNIHSAVLEATMVENALDMTDWHTCETTHCRAGWVIQLAGDSGRKLEDQLGTPLAAAKIYRDSSDIQVHWAIQFYETNENAMADIRRCAELERVKG